MTTILLYTASISQSGTTAPSAEDGSKGSALTSGTWSRLASGSYKFTRTSGLYFYPVSGSSISSSIYGSLNISTLYSASSTSCSFSCFFSGSDSSSFYLSTFLPDNSMKLSDNMLSSGSKLQVSIGIFY